MSYSGNHGQQGSNSTSLWIGEIEHWMDEKFLIESVKSYDITIKNAKIIRDKNTGNKIGYGFLEFDTQQQAAQALKLLNNKRIPNTNNKTFKLNWASYSQNKNTNLQNQNEFSIYVCELEPSVTEEILYSFFLQTYKSVISAKIIIDPITKKSKGYGFVKFSDQTEAQRALMEMNGKFIKGRPMKTNTAAFKKNADKKMFTPEQMYAFQNDPNNFLLQQQYAYINGLYMNPMFYQIYLQQQGMQPNSIYMNNNNNNNQNPNFNGTDNEKNT